MTYAVMFMELQQPRNNKHYHKSGIVLWKRLLLVMVVDYQSIQGKEEFGHHNELVQRPDLQARVSPSYNLD